MAKDLQAQGIFLARNSLAAYMRLMYPQFQRAKHHEHLIDYLHQIAEGTLDRLIVQMPPRHGKSFVSSVYFPAWYLGHNPTHSVVAATYGQELSSDFGARVRNLIQDPLHKLVFPECVMSADSSAKQKFSLTAGGNYYAVGVGGALTGRGANCIIIDDPLKDREQAFSPTERKSLIDWYTHVARTRLMPGGRIVLTQTRWHVSDLAGYVLFEEEQGSTKEGWKILNLPAIAEEGDPWRKPGEALWPEFFDLPALERLKDSVGPEAWLALFQQKPVEAHGQIFRTEWLNYYTDINPASMNKYILVDPANSKKEASDWTAMAIVGLGQDGNIYLLDLVRDRLDLPERANMLFTLHRKWKPNAVGYEQYGMQADIVYLKEKMERESYRFGLVSLGGKLRKDERIGTLVPWFRDSRIWLPKSIKRTLFDGKLHDILLEFVEQEYAAYPASRHDDVLDALSRLLSTDLGIVWPQESDSTWGDMLRPNEGTSWMAA